MSGDGMAAMTRPETLTESLRRRLLSGHACPCCGQPMPGFSTRTLAESIGLPHTVVWRFLKGGDMTGRNLDLVAAFLDKRART